MVSAHKIVCLHLFLCSEHWNCDISKVASKYEAVYLVLVHIISYVIEYMALW